MAWSFGTGFAPDVPGVGRRVPRQPEWESGPLRGFGSGLDSALVGLVPVADDEAGPGVVEGQGGGAVSRENLS